MNPGMLDSLPSGLLRQVDVSAKQGRGLTRGDVAKALLSVVRLHHT